MNVQAAKASSVFCQATEARLPRVQARTNLTVAHFKEAATDYAVNDCKLVTLHMSTHYKAAFGEQLKLVGSVPELGQWNVAEAPGMQWTEDHNWVTEVALPESSNLQFKIVHVSHNGINWEPGSNRELKAQPTPEKSAIILAWGLPEVQVADPNEALEEMVAIASESLWEPAKAGLPQDITTELEQLPLSQPEEGAAEEATAAEEAAAEEAVAPAKPPQLLKKKRKAPKEKIDGLRAAGQAAGYAAAGVAAAVVLSALAVDLTDAAIASAVIAAGATFLPSAKDSEGNKQARKGKGAAAPVLGAVELGLKAQAIMSAMTTTTAPSRSPEDARVEDYVAQKVEEAEFFATRYNPTEEDLFETSPLNFASKNTMLFNNAVSTEGMVGKETVAARD